MALPYEAARTYNQLERYGMIIILIFLATGLFGRIILPLVYGAYGGMLWVYLQIIQLLT